MKRSPRIPDTSPAAADTEDDDLALVARVARGDERAEQELVQRHYPRVIRQAQNANVPYPDYEDIAHEAMLGLIEQLRRGAFREEAEFKTWVYRLAANKINDYRRNQARDVNLMQPPGDAAGDALDAVANLALAAKPDSALHLDVRNALTALAPHHCLLLILNRTYGYSAEEISGLAVNINHWSKKQIENRLACAQENFRRALPSYKGRTRKPNQPGAAQALVTPRLSNESNEDGKSNQTRAARWATLLRAGAQRLADGLLFRTRDSARTSALRGALAGL